MPKDPFIKGLFTAGAFTKTWTTAEADTIYTEVVQFRYPEREIGLWGLFMVGTGAVNVTPKLQNVLTGTTYSPVLHSIKGYKNGNASLVTVFQPADGFESRLEYNNRWWVYNPSGFRIELTRATNTQVIWTYAGVKAL